MITMPCRDCGRLYTDNIDPKIDESKGGYIICAHCSMNIPQSKQSQEDVHREAMEFAEEIGAEVFIDEPEQEEVKLQWKKKNGKC